MTTHITTPDTLEALADAHGVGVQVVDGLYVAAIPVPGEGRVVTWGAPVPVDEAVAL